MSNSDRPLIAVFAGPTATILNSPPLASTRTMRPQRLAADAHVYVELNSAHPAQTSTEADAFVGTDGRIRETPSPGAIAVRRVDLPHDGGLYLMPLVTPASQATSFYATAERVYEEIDRFELDEDGESGVLTRLARFEHIAVAPPAPVSDEDVLGIDYFPYGTSHDHTRAEPDTAALARITNVVQETLATGRFAGAQWLEGSPVIEETLYWLNLVLDIDVPIVGQSALVMHQAMGSDGPQNLCDGVRYITSRIWADPTTERDAVGCVLVADGVVYGARDVVKSASRPGGYVSSGPGWGAITSLEHGSTLRVEYLPTRRSTCRSAVNISAMPDRVNGVRGSIGSVVVEPVEVKRSGCLRGEAIPSVAFVKYGRYGREDADTAPAREVLDIVSNSLRTDPLAGLVVEGIVPNGWSTRRVEAALSIAAHSGLPVVWCGRGTPSSRTRASATPYIAAGNLSATKARILLMATMLTLGALPIAADPTHPSAEESARLASAVAIYQQMFDEH